MDIDLVSLYFTYYKLEDGISRGRRIEADCISTSVASKKIVHKFGSSMLTAWHLDSTPPRTHSERVGECMPSQ